MRVRIAVACILAQQVAVRQFAIRRGHSRITLRVQVTLGPLGGEQHQQQDAELRIVRQYLDEAGLSVEMSVTVHPTERFSVSMRLQRSAAA